ncbi:MAG: peptidoglycan DD-metalloendopeptidase family protein [Oscillospiraceae bacterium]|nr:peptidoglycan DD-metalloendopeptidase family protein [Oscillospiraceae bacterium]
MSLHPNASEGKQTENAVGFKQGIVKFESAMVSVGSLVTYLAAAAVKRFASASKTLAVGIHRKMVPFGSRCRKASVRLLKNAGKGIVNTFETIKALNRSFAERIAEVGFGKALVLQLSAVASALKGNKKIAQTFVNYTVPVFGIALLVFVVSEKASADYGVTVEYNGQEIGVVSEESVIDEAQKVIADRATYYDTESETYITATLSLKPLGAQDEIIDEKMLADAIQDQIDIPAEQEAAAEETGAASETETVDSDANKARAYLVTVDGEFVGAVTDNSEISEYLEEIKSQYMTDDVIDVSFDKDVEYTYEQYVMPDQIVDQDKIIDKLSSIVSEPVYYEIQKGDNPWNIAHDNNMTTDELKDCFITFDGEQIEDITEFCPVGAVVQLSEEVPYLQVLTTKTVTYNEAIDYEIIKTEDPDMYKGDSKVDVKGVEGEKVVTANVTYRNDVPVKTEVLEETVISEPIAKEMRVGTRETITPVSTGSGGSGDYFWPVDGGYISAYQGDGRGHKGIDIAAPYGTPIYAAESGTVTEAGTGWNGGYGNCIRITHDDGNVTVYAHQSSLAVSYGDYVVKGQLIGYVGSTGDSSGNHLHFEVRSYGTYLNPTDYVSQY